MCLSATYAAFSSSTRYVGGGLCWVAGPGSGPPPCLLVQLDACHRLGVCVLVGSVLSGAVACVVLSCMFVLGGVGVASVVWD